MLFLEITRERILAELTNRSKQTTFSFSFTLWEENVHLSLKPSLTKIDFKMFSGQQRIQLLFSKGGFPLRPHSKLLEGKLKKTP